MKQPFDCHCGTDKCLGRIAGAKDLTKKELEGKGEDKRWISDHILKMLKERDEK